MIVVILCLLRARDKINILFITWIYGISLYLAHLIVPIILRRMKIITSLPRLKTGAKIFDILSR